MPPWVAPEIRVPKCFPSSPPSSGSAAPTSVDIAPSLTVDVAAYTLAIAAGVSLLPGGQMLLKHADRYVAVKVYVASYGGCTINAAAAFSLRAESEVSLVGCCVESLTETPHRSDRIAIRTLFGYQRGNFPVLSQALSVFLDGLNLVAVNGSVIAVPIGLLPPVPPSGYSQHHSTCVWVSIEMDGVAAGVPWTYRRNNSLDERGLRRIESSVLPLPRVAPQSTHISLVRRWLNFSELRAPGFGAVIRAVIGAAGIRAFNCLESFGTCANYATHGCFLEGGHGCGKSHVVRAVVSAAEEVFSASETVDLAACLRVVHLSLTSLLLQADARGPEEALRHRIRHAMWLDEGGALATHSAHQRLSIVVLDDCDSLLPEHCASALSIRLRHMLLDAMRYQRPHLLDSLAPLPVGILWLATARSRSLVSVAAMSPTALGATILPLPALSSDGRADILGQLVCGGASLSILNAGDRATSPVVLGGAASLTVTVKKRLCDIAEKCHGYTPADLLGLVQQAIALTIEKQSSHDADSIPTSTSRRQECLCRTLEGLLSHGGGEFNADVLPSRPQATAVRTAGYVLGQAPPLASELSLKDLVGVGVQVDTALQGIHRILQRPATCAAGFGSGMGIIVSGPPGSGTTSLALALARHAIDSGVAHAFVVNGTDIVSPILGATEANLRRLFSTARALAPCVLVLDSLDVLCGANRRRKSSKSSESADLSESPASTSSHHERLIVALCSELDRCTIFSDDAPQDLSCSAPHVGVFGCSIESLADASMRVISSDCTVEVCRSEIPSISAVSRDDEARSALSALPRASVCIIAVASSSPSTIHPSLTRSGRLDLHVSVDRMSYRFRTQLLRRFFSQSPLWEDDSADASADTVAAAASSRAANLLRDALSIRAYPGFLHAVEALQKILPVVSTDTPLRCEHPDFLSSDLIDLQVALPRLWAAFLATVAEHVCCGAAGGACHTQRAGCLSTGSTCENCWTPARLKQLWQASALAALRRGLSAHRDVTCGSASPRITFDDVASAALSIVCPASCRD